MIIHQPRLAWDAARAMVTACGSDQHFAWLSEQVRQLLGPDYQRSLADTRHRLTGTARAEGRHVEAGAWRVRFDDLLRHHPSLAEPLHALITQLTTRLSRQTPHWPAN